MKTRDQIRHLEQAIRLRINGALNAARDDTMERISRDMALDFYQSLIDASDGRDPEFGVITFAGPVKEGS